MWRLRTLYLEQAGGGFQFGVAYTYSKTLDYGKDDDSSDVSLGRPYKAFNYGPADFDQTHIFTVNYIYDVPSLSPRLGNNRFVGAVFDHWQISGTTSYATGKPKTFGTGTGLNWTFAGTASAANITDFTGGDINARPVVICFAKPGTPGAIGNLQRNLIRLPAIFNTDLAFFKNFPLGESRGIQLRWETYNLFNRANFTDINGAMTFDASGNQTNTTFGTPRATRSPRVMQASLRINF